MFTTASQTRFLINNLTLMQNPTQIPLYRTSLGAATADKPDPHDISQEFGALAGPAPRQVLIKLWTQQPIVTQYLPNAICQWGIQNASELPESYNRLRYIRSSVQLFLTSLLALVDLVNLWWLFRLRPEQNKNAQLFFV
ncbi:LOW QUALITY PROTEIN: hypothetical protein T265_13678 [Opisthorchis viverrini]|uniref:Uncharacterized protein n=1 Tax=Opisthorchis viverrini TaxID=6198 RepID=A0A074ZLP6_OPIVI|nr:LOW QUALITY PROTEIN: hypothetical protein T265_13678 [Opisthorchis viverrini]KER28006.1 LOW QUALITY PROTEIN: hypothetical protein T265_13678 [Opisthorchis viverrini]